MTVEVNSGQDIIDSRDVIERLNKLESDREAFMLDEDTEAVDLRDGVWTTKDGSKTFLTAYWTEDEEEEYQSLKSLNEDGESSFSDWIHGAALIADSYFETYAQDLARDIGAIEVTTTWPAYCIDWERAANDLQMDYTSIEFDGVTYWGRS